MNRLEELTLKSADDSLSSEETTELQTLVAASDENRRIYLGLLKIEAALRVRRAHFDVPPHAMERLRQTVEGSIEDRVMYALRQMDARGTTVLRPRFRKRRQRLALWAMAASIALIAVSIWLFGAPVGQPLLADMAGPVTLVRGGLSSAAASGTTLVAGDVLMTGTNAHASVRFSPEKTRIQLGAGTVFTIAATQKGKRFTLNAGRIEITAARQRPFRPMRLLTAQAEARVVGTRLLLMSETNATRLDVIEGKVRFTSLSDGDSVLVKANRYAIAGPNSEIASLPKTGSILKQWWGGVRNISSLRLNRRFPAHPDGAALVASFATKPQNTNDFAVRFQGYLQPPITGEYQLSVIRPPGVRSSYTQVSISPNEDPAEKGQIATEGSLVFNPTPLGIQLIAGRRYYIEIITIIEAGNAGFTLEWKRPGGSPEPLSIEHFSPYK